jgi:hypothetical protein
MMVRLESWAMRKLLFAVVFLCSSAGVWAQGGDPFGSGIDFLRVCTRHFPSADPAHRAIEAGGPQVIDTACNMYVWGIVSGVNQYGLISAQDLLAAKKRGEAGFSSYGMQSAEALKKSSDSFNLICVPDEVTVGQLRSVVSSYIVKHLDRSIWSTAKLTYNALTEAFPCTVKSSPQP